MGNQLLAQWQRGLVLRGVVAVGLLALPVVVAAAIGFSPSASGLSEGLGSLAGGPTEPPAAAPDDDSLDSAISSVAAPAAPAGPSQPGGAPDEPSTGGVGDQGVAAPTPAPGGAPPAGVDDVDPGAGGATDVLPAPAPGGGTVDQVLGGVGETVNGLLGGGTGN